MQTLHLASIRSLFPALERQEQGQPVAYFDGPAGSQVPQPVIDAVSRYLGRTNANCGAPIGTSRESDAILQQARERLAAFVGTDLPEEIVFGANMTTITFAVSRTLSRTWQPGDEVLVSQLDHDANVTPWVMAAQRAGATVKQIPLAPDGVTLDETAYQSLLTERTRLVAIGYASNAIGTVNPVQDMLAAARSCGALTYVDAVHFAPHRLIDVVDLDCDFLVCSAYKFFGPHVGVLWGRRSLLEELQPDRLRPAPSHGPGKWMTGTQNHEGIAGAAAAVEYLATLGAGENLRQRLQGAFRAIQEHEHALLQQLLSGLDELPVRIWGLPYDGPDGSRVPTVSVTHPQLTPRQLAEALAARGLYCWPGNHYAYPFTLATGLEPHGTLRIGLLHYNTAEEVERLLTALHELLD
jgi:cysteine desulfurase family protein (TIGR01976 family)